MKKLLFNIPKMKVKKGRTERAVMKWNRTQILNSQQQGVAYQRFPLYVLPHYQILKLHKHISFR